MAKKNMLIAQSGGPTAVINSSVVGAFDSAVDSGAIHRVYAANCGILGVLNEDLFDLTVQQPIAMQLLKNTPSSGLGSCRHKLNPDVNTKEYKRIFDVLKAHDIGYFFYNGGNDSMDTANKLSKAAKDQGYDIKVIGIPKTVDNDLCETDHCPGFGSAAKYINTSVLEAAYDCYTYNTKTVILMETMGRHAGWLAASGCLAEYNGKPIADFIYLPEVDFDTDRFLSDIERAYNEQQLVFAIISEGIRDKDGSFITTQQQTHDDKFGHKQLGGVADYLMSIVQEKITKRVKAINPNVLQRCAMHCVSGKDLEETYAAGYKAVRFALDGLTGIMPGYKRISNSPYQYDIVPIELDKVANNEKKIPSAWINKENNNITEELKDYVRPLIQGQENLLHKNGLPQYVKLDKTPIEKKLQDYR